MKGILLILLVVPVLSFAQNTKLKTKVYSEIDNIEPKVIEWRHHIHQNPELSNREYETAEYIAEHLKALGIEVQMEVAKTGVVGILKGGKPGPVVALRADMDALPVKERVDIPWASTVVGEYNGAEVPVMHACGHDTHVAILMGTAEVLAGVKDQLKGTVKFIFQPAEEGAPAGEEGGAELMVKEGVLKNPDVEAIFGLHINSGTPVGQISYKPGGYFAAVNSFNLKVKGAQTHGSTPWTGIDPIVTSAMIINGLQTTVSRQAKLTKEAAVVTVGSIHGGVRSNIIPEEVTMQGTIRTLDEEMRLKILKDIERTAIKIAESQGAVAEIEFDPGYPITYNDPELTKKMIPSLEAVSGAENVKLVKPITGAEDFSFFQKEVPGLFFQLGGTPEGMDPFPHHTPDFYVDDAALTYGIKAFCNLVIDYSER